MLDTGIPVTNRCAVALTERLTAFAVIVSSASQKRFITPSTGEKTTNQERTPMLSVLAVTESFTTQRIGFTTNPIRFGSRTQLSTLKTAYNLATNYYQAKEMNELELFYNALELARQNPQLASQLSSEIRQFQSGINAIEQHELQFQLDRAALLQQAPHLAQAASELDLACEKAYWDGLSS